MMLSELYELTGIGTGRNVRREREIATLKRPEGESAII
jgi:hypothetical protein